MFGVKVSGLNKNLPGKVLTKAIKSIPGVSTVANLGGAVSDLASGVGKALGIGETEADRRKDRTRKFHKALRAGDLAHIRKTASGREEGGTRFAGLRREALWVLQNLQALQAQGHSASQALAQVRAAIAGSGGGEARAGRLANLDGTPNNTRSTVSNLDEQEAEWQSTTGTAGAAGQRGAGRTTPVLMSADSAPRASKTRKRSTTPSGSTTSRRASAPARPRAKPPCKYGARVDGRCPKKPKAAPRQLVAKEKPPCAYGERLANGRCPAKPRQSKAVTAAKRKVATAVQKEVAKGGEYIVKRFGVLGPLKVLAKASLVGAAGLGAYALTKKLATLRPKNWDDARQALAAATIAARRSVRDSLPELDWEDPATNQKHMAPFNQYFKERKAILDQLQAKRAWPNLGYTFDDENPTYGDPYKN